MRWQTLNPATAGGLWIAWPKRASGVPTDLDENVVRDVGLAAGLVDNKVCAIDETWSGLRFVIRLRDRGSPGSASASPSWVSRRERMASLRPLPASQARPPRATQPEVAMADAQAGDRPRRRRSEFAITETELSAIAAAATIGLRKPRSPKIGCSTPGTAAPSSSASKTT